MNKQEKINLVEDAAKRVYQKMADVLDECDSAGQQLDILHKIEQVCDDAHGSWDGDEQ